MAFKNRTFSDEEAIGRVWDVENIKNLIGRFFYYEAANEREAVMNDLWVSEAENLASASFGRNWGFIEGKDKIQAYYIGKNRFGAVGTSTPLLQNLSAWRKTARLHRAYGWATDTRQPPTPKGIWKQLGSTSAWPLISLKKQTAGKSGICLSAQTLCVP